MRAHRWEASELIHVELRDEWAETPVRPADRLNLVGEINGCGCGGEAHRRCAMHMPYT